LEFGPRLEQGKIFVENYEPLLSEATLLCSNCLELGVSKLRKRWKRSNFDQYLCDNCVLERLDKAGRVIYLVGQEAATFFEEIAFEGDHLAGGS